MKMSNKNKFISGLLGVAMCPMMLPTAAFAADDGAASRVLSSQTELIQSSESEGADTGPSSGDTLEAQSESAGETTDEMTSKAANEEADLAAETVVEGTTASVAEVNGTKYSSLQEAIDAASRNATVKLLTNTKENVTISTDYVALDLNGYTLNGGTEKGKPALTVTARVTVMDSSEAQTGTIMREDTAENSGVSSHYVIDVQGGNDGWLFFQSGNVKNGSGAGGTKGASLVRVGDDSKPGVPGLTISGGTFTQDNFIVLKCDHGNLYVKGGIINSANSYAIQNWKNATIKDNAVINGNVSTWTFGGAGSDLQIQGGTVNGNVESVTYDGVEGKPAKVSITGGTVSGALKTVDYSTGSATDDPTKAAIEVTAGTFSTADPSSYLVEGSTVTKNDDGTYGVEKAYLAKVGETSYYTMGEAFKAQTASGEAITLLRDYTTGSTFNSGTVARVVDLNGHTWTCTGTDANSAAFEINYPNASLTVKNGKVVSSQLIGLIPSASGGTITYDNSILTFEGVEASTTATSGIETNGNNTNDTVVLKGSTLNVPNGFGIYFPSSGTLTIDNSTINAKTMGAQVCSGNLNVNSGAITVSGDPVAKTEGDGAIQDGAAISIVNRPGYKGLGKIAITGGTFTAKGDNAAIKAYTWDSSTKQESAFDNSAQTVAVSGGTFSSAVSADLCAEGYAPVENDDDTYGVGTVVAEAAGKQYASLYDAVQAVKWGGTVKLLADAESPYTLVCRGKVTFELGEYTITNTNKSGIASVIKANNGAVVTINATTGGIDAGSGATNNYAFYANSGTIIINGGNYTVGLDKNGEGNAIAYADKAWGKGPGTIRVNGGTFEAAAANNGHSYVLNAQDNSGCTIEVKGGTFKNFDPSNNICEGEGTNFVAAGYAVAAVENGSDTLYTVLQAVAQVGTKTFASLQAAIDAAQDGDTITLLADVEQNTQLAINKDITLDLNGKTIKNTQDIWGDNTNAILSITDGAKVTITGNGTIDAKENDCYTINVKKGDLTIENGTFYGNVSVVQVQEGTLSVKGGTFDLHQKWEGSSKYLFNCIDDAYASGSANVAISGGTFVGFDPSASPEGEGTSYLAPGYAPTDNGDGTYGVVAGVAQIGTKAYATLAGAVAAAQDGDTITLLSDCSGDGISIKDDTFPNGLTIDFAGHSYTVGGKLVGSAGTASNGFHLLKGNTIVMRNGSIYGDASVAGDDTTQWSGSPAIMIQNYSNLTLDGMTVKGGKQTCYTLSNNNGDTVIKDSTIIAGQNTQVGGPFAFDVCRYASYPSVSVTVEGNSVIEGCVDVSGAIGEGQNRQLTITGGTFSKPISVSTQPANIAISGGTFATEIPADHCAAGYVPVANTDGTYGVKLPEGAYALQDYRTGDQTSWTYPTQDGMAFAGWYKDAAFTTPCAASDVEGAAYAKFVNITDLLKFKGGSLRMDKGVPSESTYLRFGYTKAIPEKATYIENGWYYKRLSAPTSGDRRLVAYNNALNNDGTITSNLVFNGVAKNYYTANFTEKAFVKYITVDGTTVEAVEDAYHLRSVSEVADAILAHPMASEAEKDYATSIKSAIQ